jgi:hypothetical protein
MEVSIMDFKNLKQRIHGQSAMGALAALAIGLVVVGVTLGVGALILTQIYNQTLTQVGSNADATAPTVVQAALTAIGTTGSWLGTVVVVAIAAVIIGLILVAFRFVGGGGV